MFKPALIFLCDFYCLNLYLCNCLNKNNLAYEMFMGIICACWILLSLFKGGNLYLFHFSSYFFQYINLMLCMKILLKHKCWEKNFITNVTKWHQILAQLSCTYLVKLEQWRLEWNLLEVDDWKTDVYTQTQLGVSTQHYVTCKQWQQVQRTKVKR